MMFKYAFTAMVLLCSGCETDVPSDSEQRPCVTDLDCDLVISVWSPSCEEGILLTPTGDGDVCVDTLCEMDFEVQETDCVLEGLECGEDSEGNAACV